MVVVRFTSLNPFFIREVLLTARPKNTGKNSTLQGGFQNKWVPVRVMVEPRAAHRHIIRQTRASDYPPMATARRLWFRSPAQPEGRWFIENHPLGARGQGHPFSTSRAGRRAIVGSLNPRPDLETLLRGLPEPAQHGCPWVRRSLRDNRLALADRSVRNECCARPSPPWVPRELPNCVPRRTGHPKQRLSVAI